MPEYFTRLDQCTAHTIFPGVEVRAMAGQQAMLSYVSFEPRAVVEEHHHPHEQLGILLEGELTFTIGEETRVLRPGDMWRIPGGVAHRVVAGDQPARALDIFHPVRHEYL